MSAQFEQDYNDDDEDRFDDSTNVVAPTTSTSVSSAGCVCSFEVQVADNDCLNRSSSAIAARQILARAVKTKRRSEIASTPVAQRVIRKRRSSTSDRLTVTKARRLLSNRITLQALKTTGESARHAEGASKPLLPTPIDNEPRLVSECILHNILDILRPPGDDVYTTDSHSTEAAMKSPPLTHRQTALKLKQLIGRRCPSDFDKYQLLRERDVILCGERASTRTDAHTSKVTIQHQS